MSETPNHSYNVPDEGTTDWHEPLNENFEAFDADIELRDSGLPADNDYEPTDGGKYLDTDTGIVYEGDGDQWEPAFAIGRVFDPSIDFAYGLAFGDTSNKAEGRGATVGGGTSNEANDIFATVGGGDGNTASDEHATVAGGEENTASDERATVSGGVGNEAIDRFAAIGGGVVNEANGSSATIAGGNQNQTDSDHATVAGGRSNTASGEYATVAGGEENTASGEYATVAGGEENTASGDYAFAAGQNATAEYDGSFVFAGSDSADQFEEPFETGNADQFAVRASGTVVNYGTGPVPQPAVRFITGTDEDGDETGVQLLAGGSSWQELSDRNAKEHVTPVDPVAVLDRLLSVPVAEWSLTSQPDDRRHIGPMAQDFNEAFGDGTDERYINSSDARGVALAAIQGLSERLEKRTDRIDKLEADSAGKGDRITELETTVETQREELAKKAERIADQEERIEKLEAETTELQDRLVALEARIGNESTTPTEAHADD